MDYNNLIFNLEMFCNGEVELEDIIKDEEDKNKLYNLINLINEVSSLMEQWFNVLKQESLVVQLAKLSQFSLIKYYQYKYF